MVSGRGRVGFTSHATNVTSQNAVTPSSLPAPPHPNTSTTSHSSIKTDHTAPALSLNTILAPPRSTSLPSSAGMGHCLSTPQPSQPTPPPMSPLSAARGLTAAMAPGKFKRALAARRKKSEDVSGLLDPSGSRDEGEQVQQQRYRPPIPIKATASSPAQTSHSHAGGSAIMYTPGPQNQHGRNLSQLATQVFSSVGARRSKSALQLPRLQEGQPPALPPKPPAESPAPSNPVQTVHSTTPNERVDNRSSIIPMSPELSSAVNYMRMAAEEERKDEQAVVVVEDAKAEEHKVVEVVVEAREKPQELDKDGEKEGSNPWRMSDSTISQHTIRADLGSSARSPRPVSMAESLQSTHTIVPVSKRQSVLIDDPDFGMPEEDDSEKSTEEGSSSIPPSTPDKDIHLNILPVFDLQDDSPEPSMKGRNRRSLSLSVTTHAILSKSKLLRSPSSASGHNTRHPHQETSRPISPSPLSRDASSAPPLTGVQLAGHNTHVRGATVTGPSSSSAHQYMNSLNTSMLSPSDLDRNRNLPSLPNAPPPLRSPPSSGHGHSFRQTAVSITGGLAPAAGLAKRAVEKMGRAWGIHSSSHSSGASSSSSSYTTPPSSYSSSGTGSVGSSRKERLEPQGAKEMARAESSQSVDHHFTRGHHHKKGAKLRRTPDAPSISSTRSMTASSASMSISDSEPSGPNLGKRLRGPLRTKGGGLLGSGMVFGRDLKSVVKETGVVVGKPKVWGGRWRNWEEEEGQEQRQDGSEVDEMGVLSGEEREVRTRTLSVRKGQLKALEERKLPALVVRCAQHLLIWGIQEEGLFRVTGRPSHVSKLRVEFDSGADFDMTECGPADLDPHAVSSLFKAFLRELPEPVLTTTLLPYFEGALSQENSRASSESSTGSSQRSHGVGLPSNPRDANDLPAMRKPPSLSTLAMPSFNGMRPPSKLLLKTLQSLLSQLPEENRDLIRTVAELIRATAKESKDTKMPLSNLLLVFCPSLSMSPPLLKVLCEAEGIWGEIVIDIKPETVFDIRAPSPVDQEDEEVYEDAKDGTEEEEFNAGRRSEDVPESIAYQGSMEESEECSTDGSSLVSQPPDNAYRAASWKDDGSSFIATAEDQDTSSHEYRLNSPPLLTSSAESLKTPESAGHVLFPCLPAKDECYGTESAYPIQQPMISSLVADSTPVAAFLDGPRRPVISHPIPIADVEFPASAPVVQPTLPLPPPPPPQVEKRRSIPLLSLPSFPASPLLWNHELAASQGSHSPKQTKRKPSLHILFSKKSSSSLSSPKVLPPPGSRPVISGPYLQDKGTSSDSSMSTPISAVTAFQSSSSSVLPPQLEMAIKNSPLKMGHGIDSPPAAKLEDGEETKRGVPLSITTLSSAASASVSSLTSGYTPIVELYQHSRSSSPVDSKEPHQPSPAVGHLRPSVMRSKASTSSVRSENHLGLLTEKDFAEDWTRTVLLAADVGGSWEIENPTESG